MLKTQRYRTTNPFLSYISIVVLSVLLNAPLQLQASSAPDGYSWIEFHDINARFLYPSGWVPTFSKGKLMASLVMQKNESGTETRLTVNVVSNLSKINYQVLSRQVEGYVDNYEKSDSFDVLSRVPHNRDGYTGESLTMTKTSSSQPRLKLQRLYLAHDKRDWLLIISFQSPEPDWETNKRVRAIMMSGFELD